MKPAPEPLLRDIRTFIAKGYSAGPRDAQFNDLMLRLFARQLEGNVLYRKYCSRRNINGESLRHWSEIPAIGTDIFKHFRMACFPEVDSVRTIKTSGSSEAGHPGRVHLDADGFALHKLSHQMTGESFLLPNKRALRSLMLLPRPQDRPGLAIIHGMLTILSNRIKGEPEFFIRPGVGLDCEALHAALSRAEQEGEPVVLMGPTFSFVHFFDDCAKQGTRYHLHPGSLLLDGGGYKGISRELTKNEFLKLAEAKLGLKPSRLVNGMGLTEVSAVFFDNVSQPGALGLQARHKVVPPWARVVVIDPNTQKPVPKGVVGLLRFYCIANSSSVLAIQTDDLGLQVEEGFEILGRAKGARARGCSLAIDEILTQENAST